MAVFDIELTDIATAQVFRAQLEHTSGKGAEAAARKQFNPLREDPPPGSPYRKSAAMKLTLCDKLSMKDARRAFKLRMIREGRKREHLAFVLERRAEFTRDHPQWNVTRVLNETWRLAFGAFPPEPRRPLRPSKAACRAAVVKVEEFSEKEIIGANVLLLEAGLARADRGGIQEDTEWVYQNLDVPWDRIDAESVPSPGGVALLSQAKMDQKWFLATYHAKLLPSKSRIETEGWFEADDGQVAEMVERLREEAFKEEVAV